MADEKKVPPSLAVYSALLTRAQLAARLGLQYDNNRDLYQTLGYKRTLYFEDFATQYLRQDIAKAVINRPIDATWSDDFEISESEEKEETPFEKAFKDLYKLLGLKSMFVRLDKLSSLGRYGILMLGLDDVKYPQDQVNEVTKGARKLLFVKPLSELNAKILTWENDQQNPRYGLPNTYNVTIKNPDETTSTIVEVHWSRVIHVAGEQLESEVLGVPTLESVYNRLQDLEKMVGASAEMFWRGARPGYKGKIDPDFTMTPAMKEDLREQLDEYDHNLRRFLVNEGLEISPMEMQIASPKDHVDIQLQMISAVTGIPKRILIGAERGELASTEDKSSWFEMISARQKDLAEAQMVRPFVDFCIKHGILPAPKDPYDVIWPDMYALSDEQKARLGQTRAAALASYTQNPQSALIFPPKVFYQHMLGLDEEDIDVVEELAKSATEQAMKLEQEQAEAQAEADKQAADAQAEQDLKMAEAQAKAKPRVLPPSKPVPPKVPAPKPPAR